MKIDPVPKGLDDGDDAGRKRAPGQAFEVTGQGPEGAAAEIPQKPALVLEEDPQHPGDNEDDLTVRDTQKECLPHPFSALLQPLGMARRTKSPGAAGKHQKPLLPTVGTADAGKPAARVAAVQIALYDFLDDRPEEAVLLLETALVFGEELVEMMKKHPVEDGAFRMSGTVDSCHGQDKNPTNGPEAGRIPQETNFPW